MLNIIMDIILIFIDTLEIWHYFIIALIPIYPSILVLLISNIDHDISVYAP